MSECLSPQEVKERNSKELEQIKSYMDYYNSSHDDKIDLNEAAIQWIMYYHSNHK